MKTFRSRFLVTLACLVALAFAAYACNGRKRATGSGTVQTQTVAPAAAQPSANGTDAMTQTVDVGDGRSEADGGVMTDTATGKASTNAPVPTAKKKTKKR
ncbi:MAG TPA: hypothetical protein VHU41_07465 [Thermoanaerobaculia bacterium]|jgi:hypothetical protein|nr:hypothetical protein [Thermoanaerobaculia bacterium]